MTTPTTVPTTTPTTTPTHAGHGATAPVAAAGPRGSGVTVAADGHEGGLRAVRWAAHEAAVRQADLTILHAAPYAAGSAGSLRAHAQRILARAYTVAVQGEHGVAARTRLVEQEPRAALVEESRHAGLLVLGLAAAATPEGALVGSLALDVAGAVEGPLVVVGHPGRPAGPVLAAIRDTVADEPALRQAWDAAARYGAELEVVHATHSASAGARSRDALEELLRRREEQGPAVRHSVHIVTERATAVLAARSQAARLLVLGPAPAHRRLLGSVARTAIRLAGCPVLVAADGAA